MQRTLKVFVIPPDQPPGAPPEPAQQMVVDAGTTDALRDAAATKLRDEGYRVRALSFGPNGLVASVEPAR